MSGLDNRGGAQLRAVLAAFREEVKPELTSPQTKFRAELIDMLLTRLAAEADGGDAGELFWDDVGSLLGQAPANDAQARNQALADLLGHAQGGDDKLVALIAAIAAGECKRRVALEERVAENLRVLKTGPSSVGELASSPEDVTGYLRGRFPEDAGITATRVTVVPGGRSKATILIEFTTADGPHEIVVRKDFELGSAGISVSEEYPVICAAWEAGLPVPQPLWLEEQRSAIRGKFIAFSKVRGKSMGTLFASDASPAFLREFAATLAKLHAVDIEKSGLGDRLRWARAEHPVRALIDHFYDRYRLLPPDPLMDAAFAHLRLAMKDIGNERALVHGDAGLHNTMGDGDHLTALLDWEFSHTGDPAEDLTYCKYLVERLIPWDEFMAVYIAAGGRPVSEARMQFFTLWRTLHLAIHTGTAKLAFDSGADQDLRKAAIGYNTFPKQLRDLAFDLARYTGGNKA